MEILYLSYDGLTDPLGQSQVLPYLLGLTRRGHRFTVVSTEKPVAYAQRKGHIEALLAEVGDGIDWQPIMYTKRPPVLSTLWDVWRMHRRAAQLHRRKRFAAVHCRSYVTALVGSRLKRMSGGPAFVFDMRGFWADERVEGGLWNLRNPVYRAVYRFFKRRERDFLRQADYAISLTANARDEIRSWPGFASTPIQVIPCCVDTTLFATPQPPKGKFLLAPPSGAGIVLSYLGSLGTWYLLDEMLLFFKEILLKRPGSVFVFITPDDPRTVFATARRLGVAEDRLRVQRAERAEVPALLAQSDLSVFFIKPSYAKKASSPTKMGEILAVGVPVVCNAGVGDTDLLMTRHRLGALVAECTPAAYARVVSDLGEILEISPEMLRQTAIENFGLEKGVNLYDEVYGRLGKNGKQ